MPMNLRREIRRWQRRSALHSIRRELLAWEIPVDELSDAELYRRILKMHKIVRKATRDYGFTMDQVAGAMRVMSNSGMKIGGRE